MMLKKEQERVKELLKETITILCRNGLHYKNEFSVEALIGITLDREEVFLVNICETIKSITDICNRKEGIEKRKVDDVSDSNEICNKTDRHTDGKKKQKKKHDIKIKKENKSENYVHDSICFNNVDAESEILQVCAICFVVGI